MLASPSVTCEDEDHLAPSLNRVVEWLGGYVEADVTADISGIRGGILCKNFETVLQSLVLTFFSPILAADTLAGVKQDLITRANKRQRDIFHRTVDLYYGSVFGAHPYGLPRFGSKTSLAPITLLDLYEWHAGWVVPEKAVLTIVTPREPEEMKALVSRINVPTVRDQPKAPAEILSLLQRNGLQQAVEVENREDSGNAYVIGFPVPNLTKESQNFYFDVLQHALTGPGSIWQQVDSENVLRSIRSFYVPLAKSGVFFIYIEFRGSEVERVKGLVRDTLKQLTSIGLPDESLRKAKTFAKVSHKMAMQAPLSMIYELSHSQLLTGKIFVLDKYVQQIDKVEGGDLCAAAQRAIDLNRITEVVVKSAYEMA